MVDNLTDMKAKYLDLLREFEEGEVDLTLSALLPRGHGRDRFGRDINQKAGEFNEWLGWLAKSLGLGFTSAWDRFANTEGLYKSDRLHPNGKGGGVLGRWFEQVVMDRRFCRN